MKTESSHCRLLLTFLFTAFLLSCNRQGCFVEEQTDGSSRIIEIRNSEVKARFIKNDRGISQEFYARAKGEWILITQSFLPPIVQPDSAIRLYNTSLDPAHRFLTSELSGSILIKESGSDRVVILLTGNSGGRQMEQTIKLDNGQSMFHIEVSALLDGESPELEYLVSPFLFLPAEKPEFIHTPKLKFADDDIFGDRTFYSPAVILQEKGAFCALIPDLDLINEAMVLSPDARFSSTRIAGRPLDIPMDSSLCSMPAGLDFNLRSGLTNRPLFSFGLIDAVATHHMHWLHPSDGSMVRHLKKNLVRYGFDLMIKADAPPFQGYQAVSRFIWERYGSPTLQKPKPQVMPFEEYARVCFPASASYKGWWVSQPDWVIHNSAPKEYPDMEEWQQWEMDGWPVGGYKNNAPDWYDMIEFTTWWNNMRDAPGIYWWGIHTGDSGLVDKARRIVNLILLAPQTQGPFPVIYRVFTKRWQGNHWDPPAEMDSSRVERYFSNESKSYQTAAMSKTCTHLLRYYRLCEPNERILPFVKRYGDFITGNIDSNGCLPSWFSTGLVPNPYLRFNGEQGVHIWFLSELYLATKDQKYLEAAERMASFMTREILPKQRWLDFEVYFSCGVKPMNFKDTYTGQDPRGNVSMSWAAEGFAALYRAGGKKTWLDAGEQVIDYLSLYQTAWAPHYIYTAYPFGGTDTDNGDAAWLNGHQAMLPGIFAWYGKELGRQDLIERSVALARASLVLTNLPENVANKVYNFPNYPTGLGPENIDHEGIPQTPLRTGASWCELGGLTGISDAMRELGGLYVNVVKNLAVGVNGVNVKEYQFDKEKLSIRIENWFKELLLPYIKSYVIELKVDGLKESETYSLIINGATPIVLTGKELASYRLTVNKL
jgi:hypothetical protein